MVIAVICVPWMLLSKPLILYMRHRAIMKVIKFIRFVLIVLSTYLCIVGILIDLFSNYKDTILSANMCFLLLYFVFSSQSYEFGFTFIYQVACVYVTYK